MYFEYGDREVEYLKSRDKRLAGIIDQVGHIDRALRALPSQVEPVQQRDEPVLLGHGDLRIRVDILARNRAPRR